VKQSDVVKMILAEKWQQYPLHSSATAYAPSNIALCKYWGKRNQELNLPLTSSLSISLREKGAHTQLLINDSQDCIQLNGQVLDNAMPFSQKLLRFVNLFRVRGQPYLTMNIHTNIPIAAGLASSACGFAAIAKALNQLFGWQLSARDLSILARLGSGSASRSLWQGFVEWHAGVREDGMDSFAEDLPTAWPELCVGLVMINHQEKALSSREAMQRTVMTSALYSAWPQKVSTDLSLLKRAIVEKDFLHLGKVTESNALTMHATMLSAWPPITYCLPETLTAMQQVWRMRDEGIAVYFTQDAGPNIKLLFLENDIASIRQNFPTIEIICNKQALNMPATTSSNIIPNPP